MYNNNYRAIKYIAVLFSVFGSWFFYYLFGDQLINQMYHGKSINILNIPVELSRNNEADKFKSIIMMFYIAVNIVITVSIGIYIFRYRLTRFIKYLFAAKTDEEFRAKALDLAILMGCSWACFYSLLNQGFQGKWYLIEDLMNFKWVSPFQQRMLFLLLAKIMRWMFPALTYIQSYCISQLLPIVLGFYFIKKWAEIFVPPTYSFIAQLILLGMVIPTISYYTFYDFGIILFFTICLYLLFKRKYFMYYIVFAIGVLNHEIILFMVFVFFSMYFKNEEYKKNIWISVSIQAAIFVVIRVIQYTVMPAPNWVAEGRIWVNLHYLFQRPFMLSNTIVTLSVWYVISFIGIRDAPQNLKRCLILLPLIVFSTLFFGQFNELRQFNAFIPIAVALAMCLIRSINEENLTTH